MENKLQIMRNHLYQLSEAMEKVGNEIRFETMITEAELKERLALGLEGEAAIKHYNAWMARHGLQHLMVEE